MCCNQQDCQSQEPKTSVFDLELRGSGASGIACSWFFLASNDGVVRYTHGSEVIALYGSFGLWPTHFNEGISKWNHGLGTDE